MRNDERAKANAANIAALKNLRAFAKEVLTVTGAVDAPTIPAGALYAFISVETAVAGVAAHYWCTGDTPTTTEGICLRDGTTFDLYGDDLQNFKVTAVSGSSTLHIQYSK